MNNEQTSGLEQPIWAVATESQVLGIDLTYNQAIEVVNDNLSLSGMAIVTSEAARKQLKEHVYYKCPGTCMGTHCMYCDGGLVSCTVCGQAEGDLTKTCPGA